MYHWIGFRGAFVRLLVWLAVTVGSVSHDLLAAEPPAPTWESCARTAVGDQFNEFPYREDDSLDELFKFVVEKHPTIDRLCAAIRGAWLAHGASSEDIPQEFHSQKAYERFWSEELNALQVEFDDLAKDGIRAAVKSDALARVLAVTNLMPGEVFGGLQLKRLLFERPLILDNITINFPLSFVDTSFVQGEIDRSFADQPKRSAALSVNGTHFKKRVSFTGDFSGSVHIVGSIFETHLYIRNNSPARPETDEKQQKGSGQEEDCTKLETTAKLVIVESVVKINASIWGSGTAPAFCLIRLETVEIERFFLDRIDAENIQVVQSQIPNLTLKNLNLDFLGLANNFITTLQLRNVNLLKDSNSLPNVIFVNNKFDSVVTIKNSNLHRGIDIIENSSGALDLLRNSLGRTKISSNSVAGEVTIKGKFTDNLEISDNVVEAGLTLKPSMTKDTDQLGLQTNTVKGSALLALPCEWSGQVGLGGSDFASTLNLELIVDDQAGAVDEGEIPACPQDATKGPVFFDFTSASVSHLNWNLSPTQRYRWGGNGFRYANWGTKQRKGIDSVREGLNDWRESLSVSRVDALTYLSEFQRDRGWRTDSQTSLRTSKRLNYGGRALLRDWRIDSFMEQFLATHIDLVAVLACAVWSGESQETAPFKAVEQGLLDDVIDGTLNRLQCAMDTLRLWFLGPSGYGANPEWAMGFVVVYWFAGSLFYAAYSWAHPAPRWCLGRRVAAFDAWLQGRRIVGLRYNALRAWFKGDPPLVHPPMGPSAPAVPLPIAGFVCTSEGTITAPFYILRYSLDAMLPVVDLHVYRTYQARWALVRFAAAAQHVAGWWFITSFLASLAILAT